MLASAKKPLRAAALLGVIASIGWWGGAGAHRGWSQHRVPVSQTDEITGIAYTTYADRFVPGLDVIGLGLALGSLLFGITLLIKSQPNPRSHP